MDALGIQCSQIEHPAEEQGCGRAVGERKAAVPQYPLEQIGHQSHEQGGQSRGGGPLEQPEPQACRPHHLPGAQRQPEGRGHQRPQDVSPHPIPGRATRPAVKASCTPSHKMEIQATLPWRPMPFRAAPKVD